MNADAVQALAREYWEWRAAEQPQTDDDIPRLLRPTGWRPRWSPRDVDGYRADLAGFEARWEAMERPDPDTGDPQVRAWVVDHALIGSALARARFELDVVAGWRHDPSFYVDQSIGIYFDLLRPQGPFDQVRADAVIAALGRVRDVLAQGMENLSGHAHAEQAALTARTLEEASGTGAGEALRASVRALAQLVPQSQREDLAAAGRDAADALEGFSRWLRGDIGAAPWAPIGRAAFRAFLSQVALIPAAPEELLDVGARELARAEAFSVIESRGHRADSGRGPGRGPLPDIAWTLARQRDQEAQLRSFYEGRDLLSQPETLRHYWLAPMPDHIRPLQWLGVTDDINWQRAEVPAVSYQPDPAREPAGLGFFDDAIARDPMTGLIHEGAHSQQLALSAVNPDPVRRHYYDSGANEGVAFYNEEMLARAGLFEGASGSAETVHAFLRLRALRVGVDIGLALGRLSIDEAAHELAERVPMDRATARWEATFFAKTPGQGMTYQVGKTQILGFLADAAREPGFSLRAFHDRLWREGNVPIALQRYEVLGDVSALDKVRW
jgi:uncharacterized protein (DUF885 family)